MASIHIAADVGEVAERVLLPGDPIRAKIIAENFLDDVHQYTAIRNIFGFTGKYNGEKISHIKARAQEVFDVSGAGDTVIAVFALALAGHLNSEAAAYLANVAAGVVVAKVGTYAVSRDELLNAL